MVHELVYAKPSKRPHWGRNMAVIGVGITASVSQDEIVLQAIGTRGWSNSVDLIVPRTELDAFIKMLETLR